MIRPPSTSSGSACWTRKYGALTFTANNRSNCSGVSVSIAPAGNAAALLTSTSSRPSVSVRTASTSCRPP
jgi:hypothetical protein